MSDIVATLPPIPVISSPTPSEKMRQAQASYWNSYYKEAGGAATARGRIEGHDRCGVAGNLSLKEEADDARANASNPDYVRDPRRGTAYVHKYFVDLHKSNNAYNYDYSDDSDSDFSEDSVFSDHNREMEIKRDKRRRQKRLAEKIAAGETIRAATPKISAVKLTKLRRAFRAADADGSGAIDLNELCVAVREYGLNMPYADVKSLMERIDIDCNGTVDYNEFCLLVDEMPRPRYTLTPRHRLRKPTPTRKERVRHKRVPDCNITKFEEMHIKQVEAGESMMYLRGVPKPIDPNNPIRPAIDKSKWVGGAFVTVPHFAAVRKREDKMNQTRIAARGPFRENARHIIRDENPKKWVGGHFWRFGRYPTQKGGFRNTELHYPFHAAKSRIRHQSKYTSKNLSTFVNQRHPLRGVKTQKRRARRKSMVSFNQHSVYC